MDCRASPGLRLDRELPVHQFEPFLHAGKTQTTALDCFQGIKAKSRIMDDEMDNAECSTKFDVEFPHSAVFHGVVQGLLQDAEEAQRDFLRHRSRNVEMREADFHFLL